MKYISSLIICLVLTLPASLTANNEIKRGLLEPVFTSSEYKYFKNVKFSPDGKWFMAWGNERELHLWNAKDFSHKKLAFAPNDIERMNEPDKFRAVDPGYIVGADFYPDSRHVFVGFFKGSAITVDIETDKRTEHKRSGHTIYKAVLSKSGNVLAMENSFLNTSNNVRADNETTTSNVGLIVTQDDRYLVTGDYRYVVSIVDTSTGKLTEWAPENWLGLNLHIYSVDVSPDNDTIAAGLENGQVRLYSIREQKEIRTISPGGDVSAYFSPDGRMLVTVSSKEVLLWDLSDGKVKRRWTNKVVRMSKFLIRTRQIILMTDSGDLMVESFDGKETIFKQNAVKDRDIHIDYHPGLNMFLICGEKGEITCLKPVSLSPQEQGASSSTYLPAP